jgi:hypothetical protein
MLSEDDWLIYFCKALSYVEAAGNNVLLLNCSLFVQKQSI